MSTYKSSFNINKIKDDIIKNVIDNIANNSKTNYEKESTKALLESKIKKSKIITTFDENVVEIDSANINKTSGELYIDLLTTYGVLNMSCEEIQRYKALQEIQLNSIKTKIRELKDRLESCRGSLSDTKMPEYIIERFRSASNFDKVNRIMQRDRYGQYFPSKCYVAYNAEESYLTLPLVRQDNSLKYSGKVETANLNISFQLGEGFVDLSNNSESSLENALSESKDPWSETILSDAPLRTSFLDEKPTEVFVEDKYFYGIEDGAVCELEIKFESLNTINEITLNPFCKFPIDIIAIRYKMSDDEDESLTEIVNPNNSDETLQSIFTKEKISFRFPDILCKNIYILFAQRHYLRETYVYDPSSVYKNTLWFDSKNNKDEKSELAVFKPRYYNRSMVSTAWQNVNDKVVSSSQDLVDILIGDKSKTRKVIKYEYNYGFYNIGCFNNHYDTTGFYISKPITLSSNVKKIELYTDEKHQRDSAGNIVTDIEYYITGSKNPTPTEWIPILPKNKTIIENEMLFIQGGTRAFFRFEAEEVYCIMKNGEPLPQDSPEYHIDTNERTGKFWCALIFNYDYDSIYSVSYKPVAGNDLVDLSAKSVTSVESFEGYGSSFIVLDNNPSIDSTNTYCSVTFTNTSSSLQSNSVNIINVTDITNPSTSYKNFDTKTSDYQFYVLKNVIYFNKEISSDFIIDVTYRHLINNIVTKAVLRRNSVKDGWLTPVLKELKYKIETF